jgi:hypothetical protein
MTPVLISLSTAAASVWFVCRANRLLDEMLTCRYRDLDRLSRRANHYTSAYLVAGLVMPVLHPVGVLGTLGVYGYAFYRRQQAV